MVEPGVLRSLGRVDPYSSDVSYENHHDCLYHGSRCRVGDFKEGKHEDLTRNPRVRESDNETNTKKSSFRDTKKGKSEGKEDYEEQETDERGKDYVLSKTREKTLDDLMSPRINVTDLQYTYITRRDWVHGRITQTL